MFADLPGHTWFFLFVIVLLWLLFNFKFSDRAVAHGPSILTTTGIFATFFGIAWGLSDFDTTNVQASVPSLLNGLKTAFWGSVFGVGGALTIKLRYYFSQRAHEPTGTGAEGEVTAANLADLLKRIQQALVGNDESTLVSQLKLTRQDTNDRLDALKKAQLEALHKLGEMGSAALVEALRDVIRDFNARINEQFGENFKQLNLAVGKLLVWQEQFKSYITEATERHNQVIASMKVASDQYEQLVDQAGTFSVVANDLSSLLAALQEQKQHLTATLSYLGNLLQAASDGLPQVEAKILALTNQLSHAVTDNQQQLSEALTINARTIRDSLQAAGRDITAANQGFNEHMSDLLSKTKEQVGVLDEALERELTKSVETLGEQLVVIFQKFADVYREMTDKRTLIASNTR